MSSARKLFKQALALPMNQRAKLAAELIASVDGELDANAESAWIKEIERRARRVLAGGPRGDDWKTVLKRVG